MIPSGIAEIHPYTGPRHRYAESMHATKRVSRQSDARLN